MDKIRAWSDVKKEMEYIDNLNWFAKNDVVDFSGVGKDDHYHLMFHRGLLDMNKKETYDRDIVKLYAKNGYDHLTFISDIGIIYDEGDGIFIHYLTKNLNKIDYKPAFLFYFDFEIIGNIKENKELLDEHMKILNNQSK